MERDPHSAAAVTEVPVEEALGDAMIAGVLHMPTEPVAAFAFAHGAGGNMGSPMLRLVAEQLSERRVAVLRYNLPYRVKRPSGPPHRSSAVLDRQGIALAARFLRNQTTGPVLIGGHSYGGRQSSMLAAENPTAADGLVLFSYPLHPPGKPERSRTSHLPELTIPTVFVHGDRDPFGSLEELQAAIEMIPSPTRLLPIAGTGHDLGAGKKQWVAADAVTAITDMFGLE